MTETADRPSTNEPTQAQQDQTAALFIISIRQQALRFAVDHGGDDTIARAQSYLNWMLTGNKDTLAETLASSPPPIPDRPSLREQMIARARNRPRSAGAEPMADHTAQRQDGSPDWGTPAADSEDVNYVGPITVSEPMDEAPPFVGGHTVQFDEAEITIHKDSPQVNVGMAPVGGPGNAGPETTPDMPAPNPQAGGDYIERDGDIKAGDTINVTVDHDDNTVAIEVQEDDEAAYPAVDEAPGDVDPSTERGGWRRPWPPRSPG